MKQAGYSKRQNSRPSDRHRQQHRPTNGTAPDIKMRGNAQQCVDKYLTLARDAATSGDPVSAENYYQYADHYYRVALANRPSRMPYTRKPSEGSETPEVPLMDKIESTVQQVIPQQPSDSL